MPTNPGIQDNAFAMIALKQDAARAFWNLYIVCKTLQQQELQHGYSTTYSTTATYVLNSDGSPGSVDGTPDPTHPMVGHYLSANAIQGFQGYCVNDFINFVENGAVATADRRVAIQQMLP